MVTKYKKKKGVYRSMATDPVGGFNFTLQVEAMYYIALRSVKMFTKENEFEYYQEGGLNDYVHMLRKPISKPFTFQVEQYVGVSKGAVADFFMDPLTLGTDLTLPVVLYVNRNPASGFMGNLDSSNLGRAYVFTGCTVIAKEYGELNSEESRLHTELTTISYRELFAMNDLTMGLF